MSSKLESAIWLRETGHIVWSYCLAILSGHIVWSYCLVILSGHIVWSYCLVILSGHIVWSYCPVILRDSAAVVVHTRPRVIPLAIIREIKIEVIRHFPRTANVKKSRDHYVGVRFAV